MADKKRQAQGCLIFGMHPVREVLRAKRRKIRAIYTTKPEPKNWGTISKLLPSGSKCAIQYVKRAILDKMAGDNEHQSVIAWVSDPIVRKKFFDPEKQKFILMLDGVQDTHNLGAILRSAYCTGVEGVILCQKGSAGLTASALKASAGLAEHLEIFLAPTPRIALKQAVDAGYSVCLAVVKGGEDATKVDYDAPLCLVIGNEAVGISKDLLGKGKKICIPQREQNISYNASVAAGILLFLIGSRLGQIK